MTWAEAMRWAVWSVILSVLIFLATGLAAFLGRNDQ